VIWAGNDGSECGESMAGAAIGFEVLGFWGLAAVILLPTAY